MKRLKKYFFFKTHPLITLYLLAALIGIGGGFGALAFGTLIKWSIWFFNDLVRNQILPSPYMFPLIPMFGILCSTWITRRFAPEAQGHGVPEVMASVATRGGIIRPRVVAIKALVSAITIGTGGSVGREGPIVQIGSTLGSAIGQFFKFSGQRIKLLLACGAAAGISATFNAPIAGMMFASEIILKNFTGISVSPIIIASVMGTVVMRIANGGSYASLNIGNIAFTLNWYELVIFILLGIISGIVSWLFVKLLYKSEDLVNDFPLHWSIKALIVGLLLGIIGMIVPEILGIGYGIIENNFFHPMQTYNILSIKVLLVIALMCLAKVFSTSLTLAGGGSGGVFAPSLFIGAALGSSVGVLTHLLLGIPVTAIGVFAICGMAAVVAGTTRAPITATLIVFEMTHDYQVILPLMLTVIFSFVVASLLEKESIYTLKLSRRGEAISEFGNIHALTSVHVKEVMTKTFPTFKTSDTLTDLVEYIRDGKNINFPIVDDNSVFYGLISTQIFRKEFFSERANNEILLKEITIPDVTVLFPESTLLDAVEGFAFRDLDSIPVVNIDDRKKLLGMIYRKDIDREYKRQNLISAFEPHKV